ncbi:SDR family oxidoreductase [Sphingomonas nostoxanthinifaciens]|uniref:SDR family oxidoreductase n=1 Tax=Sphingomonas nostoxanthinifaciens TaxID=2872652 RepID=UPI001CC1C2D6|nr:SDR family oxidoreductase [Sphingomonas nostoxanthinifaciens]UAK26265.1 SDR family oxidoreductase [Sphingomonas nostoxanthinifaciens]
MRVFVTGATGWVGSAVVTELLANGHQVVGLARSDEGAAGVVATGAEVLRGALANLDVLRAGAEGADGVIHTAFNHDFSRFAANAEDDRRAIEAIGEVLRGSDRPFITTSGVGLLGTGRLATEEDRSPAPSEHLPRMSEVATEAVAASGVRAAAMRLPPSVHGKGDHGFIPILIGIAREQGAAAYIGDGSNRWSGVHRQDAARAYRLALEHGAEGGPYHAVADEAVPFKAIAEAIGLGLGLPVVAKSPEEAQAYFGWFAMFAGRDMAASSARTRSLLGWQPTGPDFLTDIAQPAYYEAASAH